MFDVPGSLALKSYIYWENVENKGLTPNKYWRAVHVVTKVRVVTIEKPFSSSKFVVCVAEH